MKRKTFEKAVLSTTENLRAEMRAKGELIPEEVQVVNIRMIRKSSPYYRMMYKSYDAAFYALLAGYEHEESLKQILNYMVEAYMNGDVCSKYGQSRQYIH